MYGLRAFYSLLLFSLTAVLLISFPADLQSQDCFSNWYRPVVCSVKTDYSVDGKDWKNLGPGDEIKVPMGGEVIIEFTGIDQDGRRFPEDRFWVGVDEDYDFNTYFMLVENKGGFVKLRARNTHGDTALRFWLPGNLNFEWEIELKVKQIEEYTMKQSEYIVRGLYLAILGREPDRGSVKPAVMEVQRGRIKSQVKSMCKSAEFHQKRKHIKATDLLDEFYQALMGRKPDSEGVRTYLRKMEKKKYSTVILEIIKSEEYQRKLMHIRR